MRRENRRDERSAPYGLARFGAADLGLAVSIVVSTLLAYGPTYRNGFVSIDDPVYLTANRDVAAGLTWHGVKWALTTTHDGNWFPLTWLSHMADVQLFGLQSGPHHVVSLLLHVCATLLLFLLLRRATGARWPAAFAALLFGLHPLHVESVAWAAERKDVLSGLFWLVTLWSYVHYARQPGWRRYLAVVVAFSLGLMAKAMIVTLPFALLLLDVWPLRRVGGDSPRRFQASAWDGAIVREKLPLFALAAAGAAVTFLAQRSAGSVAALQQVPVASRLANVVVSYGAYISSFVWPTKLALLYPYELAIPAWRIVTAAALIVGVSALAWHQRRARPYLAVGWLWFLGTLLPVIGFVQVGDQARADRYMYVPLIGLSIAVAWALADVVERRPWMRVGIAGGTVACSCALAVLTWGQVQVWQNDRSLFEHALAVTEGNFVARDGLGRVLQSEGRLDDAIAQFREAVRIRPLYAGSRNNLGEALLARGQAADAVTELTTAIALDPNVGQTHLALGMALAQTGRPDEAIVQLQEGLRIMPESADAHYDLAKLLLASGRSGEAARELAETVRMRPEFAEGHFNLANVLAQAGRMTEAIAEYRTAVQLRPDDANARCNLGTALATSGQLDEAIAQFSEALRLQPDLPAARANLEYAQQARAAAARR